MHGECIRIDGDCMESGEIIQRMSRITPQGSKESMYVVWSEGKPVTVLKAHRGAYWGSRTTTPHRPHANPQPMPGMGPTSGSVNLSPTHQQHQPQQHYQQTPRPSPPVIKNPPMPVKTGPVTRNTVPCQPTVVSARPGPVPCQPATSARPSNNGYR